MRDWNKAQRIIQIVLAVVAVVMVAAAVYVTYRRAGAPVVIVFRPLGEL